MKSRILLVDPCPIIHQGLRAGLKSTEFEIQFATATLSHGLEILAAKESKVDLVISEFEFPDGSSVELQIAAKRNGIPLVLFSDWSNPVFIGQMVAAGAYGLIPKHSSLDQIIASLQKIQSGKMIWRRVESRRVTGALAARRLESHLDFPLTEREFQILQHVGKGHTNKVTAEQLGISYETVKEHVQNVLAKLRVKDRTQAALLAARKGLL